MLLGSDKVISSAVNEDYTYILKLVKSLKCWRIQTHINFETRTIFKGTEEQCTERFYDTVSRLSLKIR